EVDDGRPGVCAHEAFVEHGHAGGRDAGVLVEHERVPEGDERPGERGPHHGGVDVGDDAEVDLGSDDPDRGLNGLGTLGPQRRLVPTRDEGYRDPRVDDAPAIGEHLDPLAGDLDDDRNVAHGYAREAPPPPDALLATASSALRGLVGREGPAEQAPAEDAPPLGGPVAGVRHDGGHVPTSAGPALAHVVDPVLEARGTMPDLALSGSGRGGGTRRHPLSLSWARVRSENAHSRGRGTGATTGRVEAASEGGSVPNVDLILGADPSRKRAVRTEPTQRGSTQRLA